MYETCLSIVGPWFQPHERQSFRIRMTQIPVLCAAKMRFAVPAQQCLWWRIFQGVLLVAGARGSKQLPGRNRVHSRAQVYQA